MPATTTAPKEDHAAPAFDPEAVRAQFPALRQAVYDDTPLVYLDSAATSQKPEAVLQRMQRYYATENSNVHRGVHRLSQDATDAYEAARRSVARLIGAPAPEQVIFTRGTTESINLVAQTYGRTHVGAGDEIVVSEMEHHANIVPWQMLCEATGATLRVLPMTDRGELRLEQLDAMLTDRTKLVALVHISNVLGTINPAEAVIEAAHAKGIPVLLDGAQSTVHLDVDVEALGVDFFVSSSHKMFGPTGIGFLYGTRALLEALPPYHGGGDMIDEVSFEKTTYAGLPHKLEAGTPHIAGAIGMGAAAEWILAQDRAGMEAHEADVLAYATRRLEDEIDGLRVVGTAAEKTGALSFVVDGVHPYDAGTLLDRMGVAVRTGHHCAQPLMQRLGLPGTIRASFACYNTRADADALADALRRAVGMLR